jgi:uncharacterized protein YcgL (UPF0745 family)
MDRQLVRIYKSKRRAEMYLYVIKARGLVDVPEALLEQFGVPELVLDFLLTPDRKLARVHGERVLEEIARQGFYLQLPPQDDPEPTRFGQGS